MINLQTQKLDYSINNVKIPRPRMQNKVSFNQQADSFTPSFCSAQAKGESFLEKLFKLTPISNDKLTPLYELDASIPSSYKF